MVKNMAGTTVKGWQPMHVILLVVVLIVAGIVVAKTFNLTLSVAGTGGSPTPTPTQTYSSGTCPSTGLTTVQFQGTYLSSLKVVTQVSTTAALYLQGAATQSGSVTTSSSGYTANTLTVQCGSSIWALYGDGTTYYQDPTQTVSVGNSANFQIFSAAIKPMITLQQEVFFNGTTYSTQSKLFGTANGAAKTVQVTLTAGNGVYCDTLCEFVLAYNASEYSSVTMSSYNGGPVPVQVSPVLTSVMTGDMVKGYATVAYTFPGLSYSNSSTYNINFQASTFNANTVVNVPIQGWIKDGLNYVNNGQVLANQFVNPSTKASIGLTTIELTSLTAAVDGSGSVTTKSVAINAHN